MPANHPNPRPMVGLFLVALLAVILIPAVSAEETEIYNETYSDQYVLDVITVATYDTNSYVPINTIVIGQEHFNGILTSSIVTLPKASVNNYDSLNHSDYWDIDIVGLNTDTYYGSGEMGYYKFKSGELDYIRIMLFIDDMALTNFASGDIEAQCAMLKITTPPTGTFQPNIKMTPAISRFAARTYLTASPLVLGNTAFQSVQSAWSKTDVHSTVAYRWQNTVKVFEDGRWSKIYVDRTSDVSGHSDVRIEGFGNDESSLQTDSGINDVDFIISSDFYPFSVNVYNPLSEMWYNETFFAGSIPITPASDTVTVYVRNSQTGALLANANLAISANVEGDFYEVVNQTVPSGIYSIDLQPTGGGDPNPDYYRLWVTLDGYNSQMPYIDFELTGATTLYVYMEPTAGGPDDENKTYIEFYVRDLNANPIAGAAVTCGGYTLITNSAGYTQFELPNNAAYPYRVTKSGYVTIEGRAGVSAAPRHTVNVVLGPGSVPTYTPTLGPGETPGGPGATPTPDTRTNEQKGQAIIDLIADFAEPIAILAILATIFGLMKMMTPGRR